MRGLSAHIGGSQNCTQNDPMSKFLTHCMAHGKRRPMGLHLVVRAPHVAKAVRDLPMCLERVNPSPFRQRMHRASLLRIGLGDQIVKYGNGQSCTANYLARHGGLECPCRQEDYMSNELQLHVIKILCRRIPTSPTVEFSKGAGISQI